MGENEFHVDSEDKGADKRKETLVPIEEKVEALPLNLDILNPELTSFQRVEVTKVNDELPWKPPTEVSVTMPDGTITEPLDATTPVFGFSDVKGNRLTVSIADAGHIDSLHIKATEPGSKFDYDNLTDLFTDVAALIPESVSESQEETSAFSVETGRHMGQEGLASMAELVEAGKLSEEDIATANLVRDQVAQLNEAGDAEASQDFVVEYRRNNPNGRVQFKVIRSNVIVPVVASPKRDTTKLFMVFGPGPHGKTLYTMAPGRYMPRHPRREEHLDEAGSINEESFRESQQAWFETVMLEDEI